MSDKTGGPAFPQYWWIVVSERFVANGGMTLRDYAEIKFIAALISNPVASDRMDGHQVVEAGKSYADEWLAQREEGAK